MSSKLTDSRNDIANNYKEKAAANLGKSIASLLTPKINVSVLDSRSTLRQGLEKMRYHGYTALPVITKAGTYIGTVNEGDFLWHMLDSGAYTIKAQEEFLVSDIIRKDWNPPVKIDATLDELLLRVMEQNFVPVIDDRAKFVGIVTRKSIIKYYYDLLEKQASESVLRFRPERYLPERSYPDMAPQDNHHTN